jgi:hypothetical protein
MQRFKAIGQGPEWPRFSRARRTATVMLPLVGEIRADRAAVERHLSAAIAAEPEHPRVAEAQWLLSG